MRLPFLATEATLSLVAERLQAAWERYTGGGVKRRPSTLGALAV